MTWTGDMGMASFDDVRIEGPGIKSSAVSSVGRLSRMWGKVKGLK